MASSPEVEKVSLQVLREPGLNEKRCIVRHALGFYTALVVAGIYEFADGEALLTSTAELGKEPLFYDALRTCVKHHPILSTVIDNEDSERPLFRLASELDLTKHLQVINSQELERIQNVTDEHEELSTALESIHNTKFDDVSTTPPWRVYLARLPYRSSTRQSKDVTASAPQRVLIAYAFSHSHGDGLSGLLFHNTFLRGLNDRGVVSIGSAVESKDVSDTHKPKYKVKPDKTLPPALDAPNPLPISWSYLFSTLLKEFLPKDLFQASFFNPWAQPKVSSSGWTGSLAFSTDDNSPVQSASQILSIGAATLRATLNQCRSHEATLTGALHQIITHALCTELSKEGIETSSLQTSTAINLRKALGTGERAMGVMASAVDLEVIAIKPPVPAPASVLTPKPSSNSTNAETINNNNHDRTGTSSQESSSFWTSAQSTTQALSRSSSTTSDQAVGLLRYLTNFRSWHTKKLEKVRDTAYELSNLMMFDVDYNNNNNKKSKETATIQTMLFSQPADVTGPALSVNVVSVKGGDLVLVFSWQVGALGLGLDCHSILKRNDRQHSMFNADADANATAATATATATAQDVEDVERKFVARVARCIETSFSVLSGIGGLDMD